MVLQQNIVYIIMYRNVVMFIHDSFVGARLGPSQILILVVVFLKNDAVIVKSSFSSLSS